ncbi:MULTISPECIES: ABC transporter permease [unclassified Fibrobacter]|uniref:ABC transporter permease n=1 Tax=unclassified Fibrobacter TaxID=2634177 RepID=UPI00090F0505|nr:MULTISPECIES: ABC transporter permease subunit [unclassified Fibrobacter]MCQ2100797.1 ABC transporter permease subunit [Fibrobacter sp.]OWV06358.1 ABC transporter permease [Fibrobacter sp. UWH3]SHL50464.1 microcin C transport system permease protein [Fibrobacter sp. UWH6]
MKVRLTQETLNRLRRFRRNRRAFWSLVVLVAAYLLSLTSPWTVNDEPLYMSYNGKSYFPAFARYSDKDFGGSYDTEADYGALFAAVRECEEDAAEGFTRAGGCPALWTIMPPVAHDPLKADLDNDGAPPFAPSAKHWLGTDSNGRDVLARLIHGFRICISFSLLLTVLGTFLGIVIGGIQGYLGKFWDTGMQRIIEIWSSLPMLYVVILIGSIYGRSFWLLILIMAAFNWISLSYYMRAEFMKLRGMTYVQSARVLGLGHRHIFFKEILPNAMTPVVTLFPFTLIGGIGSLTSLDFLGFGLQPPTPSWGELMSQGLNNLYAPWISVSTVAALFVTLLLTTFVGEGVRDAMDPKSGDRYE